ncbi:MAG: oxygen-dependent coproporphyrinogen oxidase [Candidatus Paracaedimonas acanthamoebae]|uniref:Oxygen-dependent coproporphyrinogen-III oxidase n=1 Tax=Candidatus Paracaedimonas acanthamoebae TaxID=244581 RepID=A0A8J7PIP7_9PROT|nr:oxygen-dependent coproporphyrinogen oxidase [Candidatus Paracaedimonas acanthamoebae]
MLNQAQKRDLSLEPQKQARSWFETLRDQICQAFENIEEEYASRHPSTKPGKFIQTPWQRTEGGGGVMSLMHGCVFEKVGVNVSTVWGKFNSAFSREIPGTEQDPTFWASGISLVAHMCSPLVPAVHMNTRHIVTQKSWFGGGVDLTPYYPYQEDIDFFHDALKSSCDKHNSTYYPDFKKACDDYFYLPHRQEPRGAGGIFYDYLNTNNWQNDFTFTQDVGKTFLKIYPQIVRHRMFEQWIPEQRRYQLMRRGRYVEFNLLYDRGTRFGLQTGGNIDAILMSLPPQVEWP